MDVTVGAAGVDLFFVISGFIMATVAPGRKPGAFLAARMRRIYPIYWLCLIPWIGIASMLGLLSLPKLVASVTLWPVFGDFYRPVLPAGWSLCFEMLFYLGTAAALAWGARRILLAYLALVALSFIYPTPLTIFIGNLMALEFLAGVAIARFAPRLSAWWLVPAVLLLVASPRFDEYVWLQQSARVFWWGLPAVLIAAVARSHERLFQSRYFDIPVFLGDASYSIYLIHQLILIPLLLPSFIEILLAVAAGAAIYVGVERRLAILPERRAALAG
jgi:exopolysaccharide production protein ExoZ